jgi:hypothetical protein
MLDSGCYNFLKYQSWRNIFMRKSWLVCVLMGTMAGGMLVSGSAAWGQAPQGATPAPPPAQSQPPQNEAPNAGAGMKPAPAAATPAVEIPENAPVLTITGVCPAPATTASKTAAAGKTTATKNAAAKKPADCKTVITRKEFEKIAAGLSPNVTPQLKRQLATALPKFMAMSEAAKKEGLEKTDTYKQTLEIAKMQILTTQLQRHVQDEADKVPPQEVEDYYKKNPEAYEEFSLDRLFIPRNKQMEADKDTDESKMTPEQIKAKADAEKAKQDQGQKDLDQLAEALQKRAAAGEDFVKLQKEAYDASGMKMENPTINLPSVRRTGLPPGQQTVFDLKVGEVSPVISDNGGHYIYKVVSKNQMPLDEKTKVEIHNTLKTQRLKEKMDKYQNSYKVDQNDAYFGPANALGGRPGPPHMGMRPSTPAPQPGPASGSPSSGNSPSASPAPAAGQPATQPSSPTSGQPSGEQAPPSSQK